MYAEAEKVKDTFAKEKANKNYCQLKRNDSFNEFKFLSAIVSKNESTAPIQRKLIYQGKELKQNDSNDFITKYERNKDYLNCYSDENNNINKIDANFIKFKEHRNNQNDNLIEFIKWLITDEDYYYIGRKNDIINTLVDIASKIEPYVSIPSNDPNRQEKIVKSAIYRMYCQSNNDNIQDQGINLSEHLIELVKNKLGKYKSKNEYQLINKPNDYNGNNMIQSNTGSRKFQLVKGKYIYRTMPIKELNDLMGISTKNEKFYNINHDNANLNIINGHAGNLTQAVTYGGVLVRFAMKDEFINSVSNSIQVNGGEGTVDNEKVGLKGENEGMLGAYRNTPDKPRSFSFYINGSASKTFLENVENFEILQLGKGNI